MKYLVPAVFYLMVIPLCLAQVNVLSGYIQDASSHEALIGANVYVAGATIGTTTNEYGYFSLPIARAEPVLVSLSYVGYQTETKTFITRKDTTLIIYLTQVSLDEVVVSDKSNEPVQKSAAIVPLQILLDLPALGGERDILKSLAVLPGVSIGAEGTSNLYIRGGTPDQNLILLDGIPVYNVNHLGGYLSVINEAAINHFDLYKGDAPARYGGRLSSVLDIQLKEGNKQKIKGNVNAGIVTSGIELDGPLVKDKSSFLVAGRVSYWGLINLFRDKATAENYLDYWLYDLNAKLNYQLRQGKLFLSYYSGMDDGINSSQDVTRTGETVTARINEKNTIRWGNKTSSIRYVLPLRKNLFAKLLVGNTQYRYLFDNQFDTYQYAVSDTMHEQGSLENESKINDWIARMDLDYQVGESQFFRFGGSFTWHDFKVGSTVLPQPYAYKAYPTQEWNTYVEDEIKMTDRWSANVGLRYGAVSTGGQLYHNWEPRLMLRYRLSSGGYLKGSFTQYSQYLFLLNNNGFGFPNDIWVPATTQVPPPRGQQFALDGSWETDFFSTISVSAYYKIMHGLIDYPVGETSFFDHLENWENLVEKDGSGSSYGMELFVQKSVGTLNGFLSYTLSWNNRQFTNINRGRVYPYNYDRRHDLTIGLFYQASQKWKFSAQWIGQSGRAVTLPVAAIPGTDPRSGRLVFQGRNNGRMPMYHRLDVGADHQKTTKNNHLLTWHFSIYNAYNRVNPFYLRVSEKPILDENNKWLYNQKIVKQVSLFNFLPSISLSYAF